MKGINEFNFEDLIRAIDSEMARLLASANELKGNCYRDEAFNLKQLGKRANLQEYKDILIKFWNTDE